MRIPSGVTSIFKLLAAATGIILPALPVAICLVLRFVEGWKLWDTTSRFTALDLIAWVWTIAYLAASTVIIFQLDDEKHLKRLETLIDVSNVLPSGILAVSCAKQDVEFAQPFPHFVRLSLYFLIFLIPQFLVTYLAGRARIHSKCLYRGLHPDRTNATAEQALELAAARLHHNAPIARPYTDAAEVKMLDHRGRALPEQEIDVYS
jgi:hypothetical protein